MVLALSQPSTNRTLLSINVLGRFELLLDGRPIDLHSRKARALLGYLVLNEACQESRERLVGIFWSNSDAERARGSLRQCLREIRSALPESAFDGFEADRLAISLDRSRLDVDLWNVLDDARHGRAPERLLDGPGLLDDMLHDLDSVDPEFSAWLAVKRKTLQERILRQLESLLRRNLPDDEERLRVARIILNLDPTQEEACRAIMRILAERGDTAGALREYKNLWDLLTGEYDTEPDRRTQDLLVEIKKNSPLSRPAARKAISGKREKPPVKTSTRHEGATGARGRPAKSGRQKIPAAGQSAQTSAKIVLAIGPFTATGPDGAESHILQGFRRELIDCLWRFREWTVRDQQGGSMPASAGSEEFALNADGVHAKDGIRLSMSLKDVSTNDVLWTQTLVLSLDNLFSMQRNLVRKIASKLNVEVSAGRLAQMAPQANENLRAYDIWLRGQANMMTFDPLRWQEADGLFRSIIARHPDFGPAYSSLAQLQNTIHFVHPGVMRSMKRAEEALKYGRTATHLDPSDSRAQLSMGWAYAMSGQHDRAATHHALASELNENDPWTLVSAALGFAFRGDRGRARKLAGEALDNSISPVPTQWRYQAMIRYMCEDYEDCIAAARKAEHSIANVFVWKGAALHHLGRKREAQEAISKFFQAVHARWFNSEPATPHAMTRWFLNGFPIASECDWRRLRDDFAGAGAAVECIRYNDWMGE